MARIFTIQFRFREEIHNTMVSVKTTPLSIEYTLHNLDFELLTLLPGNTLISTSPQTLFFVNATPDHSAPLMNSIIKAVSTHLQEVTGMASPGTES